ncbi:MULTISPECIES: DUF4124 domain-containing protein [unclassified Pseudomonas]|uniref:DUF4124 domain-containing protein n=1 Tax=unclassified Pseudomonas TaxID=196821 RepID=UPI0015B63C6D|nr:MULTISPECIES: DUF4124 domain-containing protein [unclassified Pseudomonas]
MRIAALWLLWITLLPVDAAPYHPTAGHCTGSDRGPSDWPPSNRAPAACQTSQRQAYRRLQLNGVPEQGALRANNGSFSVQVDLHPPLKPSHRLRLLLDGEPHGAPGRGPQLHLSNLDRGLHRLAVQVLEGEQVLQQSAEISFFLLRAHR